MNCTDQYLQQVNNVSTVFYIFLQVIQTVLCMSAPFMFSFFDRKYTSVYIHANTRTLIVFFRITSALYCCSFSLIEIFHIGSRFVFHDCDLLVPDRVCIWFRIVQSWATVVFQFFFIAVVLEILLRQSFPCLDNTRIVACVLGCLVYFIGFHAVYRSVPIDLASDGYLSNCASLEHKNREKLGSIFIWYLCLDTGSLLSFVVLKYYIKWAFSKRRMKFDVNKQVEKTELSRAYSMMLPNAMLHFVCFLYISLSSMFVFSKFESTNNPQIDYLLTNAVPLYVFISPLVWCVVLRREMKKVACRPPPDAESQMYFDALAVQWGDKVENVSTKQRTSRKSRKVLPETTSMDP